MFRKIIGLPFLVLWYLFMLFVVLFYGNAKFKEITELFINRLDSVERRKNEKGKGGSK